MRVVALGAGNRSGQSVVESTAKGVSFRARIGGIGRGCATRVATPDCRRGDGRQEEPVGKLKHQRRGRPRRPTDRAKSRVRQRRAAAAAQDKLMRWYRDRSR